MNRHQCQLIIDNPNLSHRELARFMDVSAKKVFRYRRKLGVKQLWRHKGLGMPFHRVVLIAKSTLCSRVEVNRRVIHTGCYSKAAENVDRVIFCLENNDGKLPPTMLDNLHDGLEFVK